jgi:hypothetical protein
VRRATVTELSGVVGEHAERAPTHELSAPQVDRDTERTHGVEARCQDRARTQNS